MNTCKDCKWWNGGNGYGRYERSELSSALIFVREYTEQEKKFFTSGVVAIESNPLADTGRCRNPKLISDYSSEWENVPVYSGGVSSAFGTNNLIIGRDFGCIHHESK